MGAEANDKVVFCDRNHFLFLKGIAIIMVVLCHMMGNSGVTWFTPFGGIGVAVFLFCSGYGVYYSLYKNRGGYWKKRFLTVYIEFILIEIIAAIVLKRSIVDVLFELSFIKVLHPFGWYLQYLFGCYIFAYIVYGFIKNRKVQITLTIAAAVISFVVFYQLKMGTKAEQAFSFTGGLLYAMYSKNTQVPQKINFKCILLGMSMLFIGAFALFCKQLPFFRNEHPEFMIPLDLVLKSTVALGLIILTCKVYFGEKIIHPIGRFSYSIYLVHAYTIMLAQKLAFSRYIFFVLFFLSTTIIATISWYFIIYKIKDKVKKIIKV